MLDEKDFQRKADTAFEELKKRLLVLGDEHGFDVEGESGKLEVVFEEPEEAKFVISPNTPVREIWISALSTSFKPVGRGSAFQIAVVLKIRPCFHINAREKSEDYLIATDLRADLPAGFKSGEVSYPKGELHSFTFSKKPLNVYQNTVTLRLPVTAPTNAPLGAQHIPLKLRYQACSTEICLPPVTLDLDATFTVAASPSSSKPAEITLFSYLILPHEPTPPRTHLSPSR